MHLAAARFDAVSIIKYLLREYKGVCIPMLMVKNSQGATPLQVAGGLKVSPTLTSPCLVIHSYQLLFSRLQSLCTAMLGALQSVSVRM